MKKQNLNSTFFSMWDANLKGAYNFEYNEKLLSRKERRTAGRALKKARKKGYLKNEPLKFDNLISVTNKNK